MKPVFVKRATVQVGLRVGKGAVNYHVRMGQIRALRVGGGAQRIDARGLLPDAGDLPEHGILTSTDVAELLDLSLSSVLSMARSGRLPMSRRHGAWAIGAATLRRWVAEHTEGEHAAFLVARGRP